jgi:hypothetical protein
MHRREVMPKYVFVSRVVSFPVHEIETETLEEALEKYRLGCTDAVEEPVDEDVLVRCYREDSSGRTDGLSPEEAKLLAEDYPEASTSSP